MSIGRKERESLLKQIGCVLFMTGLSGSGKSTIANAVSQKLYDKGILNYTLDGDGIRNGINNNLGFSAEDRNENIRRVAEIGKLFVDSGVLTIAAFISPTQSDRDMAKEIIGEEDFHEIFIKRHIDTCIEVDPKGLYKKALNGEIKNFTGIDSEYEEPQNPSLVVDTSVLSEDGINNCADQIIIYLQKNNLL